MMHNAIDYLRSEGAFRLALEVSQGALCTLPEVYPTLRRLEILKRVEGFQIVDLNPSQEI